MPSVEEFNDLDTLSELRPLWTRLLAETPRATFFQSLDWLQVYWEHFGGEQQLRVMLVMEGNRTTGIVPLVVRRERTRVGTLRFLTFPLDYWGSFYGPISAFPAVTLRAALGHVQRTARNWDALELRWIGATKDSCEETVRAMQKVGMQPQRNIYDHTAVVSLGRTWPEYLASRSSKWRTNYRRQHCKMHEAGRLEYLRYRPRGEVYGDQDPRWDLYDACLQLAQASWQGSSTTGTTLTHGTVRAFLRDAHAAAARFGALDLNLLKLNDVPVAFAYNYAYRGNVSGLRVGFDPATAPPGAGNFLTSLAIQDSFARRDLLYDLGVGSLGYKRRFQTHARSVYRCGHFPRRVLRSQLLWLKRRFDEFCARPPRVKATS